MIAVLCDPVISCLLVIDKNLERAARGGHKVAAYVAAILLYMANGGAGVDNTVRQYMRQVVGDEPVKVPWSGTLMLNNEECYQICEKVAQVRRWLRMRRMAVTAIPLLFYHGRNLDAMCFAARTAGFVASPSCS